MDTSDVQKWIQKPNFYLEIKDQLKQGDDKLRKIKINPNASSIYSDTATISTMATKRRRPKTANYQSNKDRNRVTMNSFYKNL